MKKILGSILTLGIVATVAVLATNAYFSDTETSTGNTFQAGAIDLKIDNDSYYNGEVSLETTWDLKDLTVERFFNFTDLKPGDWGEDTISVHVDTNEAYVCANLNITDNSDNGITEAEDEVDGNMDDSDGTADGDLAGELNFIFWNDDGDNVLETGEDILTQGPASNVLGGTTYALADSQNNLFEAEGGLLPEKTYYIGKAWCFGKLGINLQSQSEGNPTLESGVTCDGSAIGNISQTDRLMGDISFYAVQTRHNAEFTCATVNWDNPTVSYRNLENKDNNWDVIEDDVYGTIAYSSGATNFYGVVQGQGLEPNSKYQITLSGSGECGDTDDYLATFGANLFESGYWNNWAPNLSDTCTSDPGEGLYNMNLIDDWYTFESDGFGNFVYPFNLSLPAGSYANVKILVKKMLDTHVTPWVDTTTEHTTNLFEVATIDFVVN